MAEACPLCSDDRQYIPEKGQTWTDLEDLSNHYSVITKKINDSLLPYSSQFQSYLNQIGLSLFSFSKLKLASSNPIVLQAP